MASSLRGEIVWIHGPFPAGSFPGLKIFRLALKDSLEEGEMLIADKVYRDISCVTPEMITGENKQKAKNLRARHEKNNGCITSLCRHEISKHSIRFHAVANIVQLKLKLDPAFRRAL